MYFEKTVLVTIVWWGTVCLDRGGAEIYRRNF